LAYRISHACLKVWSPPANPAMLDAIIPMEMARPMMDRAVPPDAVNPRAPEAVDAANDHDTGSVEQRLNRLEDALAALQDTRQLEQRIVARVAERVDRVPVAVNGGAPSAGTIVDAGRRLLPAAVG